MGITTQQWRLPPLLPLISLTFCQSSPRDGRLMVFVPEFRFFFQGEKYCFFFSFSCTPLICHLISSLQVFFCFSCAHPPVPLTTASCLDQLASFSSIFYMPMSSDPLNFCLLSSAQNCLGNPEDVKPLYLLSFYHWRWNSGKNITLSKSSVVAFNSPSR